MKRAKWIAAILLSTVMLAACGGAADEEDDDEMSDLFSDMSFDFGSDDDDEM